MSDTSPPLPATPALPVIERNRLEVIRFPSDEEYKKALQVLIDLGEPHRVTSYNDPREWWVRTLLVRRLRAFGVQFQWLTENS